MKPVLRLLAGLILSVTLIGCSCYRSSHYDPTTGLVYSSGFEKQECRFFLFRWIEDVFEIVFLDSKHGKCWKHSKHSQQLAGCCNGHQTLPMPNHLCAACSGALQTIPMQGTFNHLGDCANCQTMRSTVPMPGEVIYGPMELRQGQKVSNPSTTVVVPAPPAEAKEVPRASSASGQPAPLPGKNTRSTGKVRQLMWVPKRF